MAHQHLAQLHAACLGLKATLDAALAAAGLDPLDALEGLPTAPTRALKRPRMVVTLAGGRDRERPTTDETVAERVGLLFTVVVRGSEAQALAYEGVLSGALGGAKAAVKAAVTDASVQSWELAGGSSGPADEAANGDAWEIEVALEARLVWRL